MHGGAGEVDGYTSLHRGKGVGDTYQELGGGGEGKFIKVRAGKELLKGHQCNFRTPIAIIMGHLRDTKTSPLLPLFPLPGRDKLRMMMRGSG